MSTTPTAQKPTSLKHRFKSIDPHEAKLREEEAKKAPSKNSFNLFKPNITPYKFKDGRNQMRFVPQPKDSPFDWAMKVSVLQFFSDSSPLRGTFRVMDDSRDGLLNRVRKLLSEHPEFKYKFKSESNQNGITLSPRPKVIFLGFDITAPDHKLQPVVLPGTLPFPFKDGKPRPPQAGTQIIEMCHDQDSSGNYRTGNIYELDTGRVIRVEVYNAGTIHVKYIPSFDDVYNIDRPEFFPVLEQIQNWDYYLEETTNVDLVNMLKGYLPANMYDFVNTQMRLDSLLSGHPTVQDPVDEPEEGVEADIPLPVEVTESAPEPAPAPEPAKPTQAQAAPAPTATPAAAAPVDAVAPSAAKKLEELRKQLESKKAVPAAVS